MKKYFLLIILALAILIVGYFYYVKDDLVTNNDQILSFEDCVAAGNSIMKSYPRQCRAGDQIFVEDIGNELEKMDLIRIESPRPSQVIRSPLKIIGSASGVWFFEGDFPVRLLNAAGEQIAVGIAIAQGEWMTEDFVSFEAELDFSSPGFGKGKLILQKDNPSDLRELDDQLEVPVIFE